MRPEALPLFGIANGKAPCHATYHYFFQALDADALARVLGSYALGEAEPGHIAIDGKPLKGSRRLDDKAVHVLSAFSTSLGAVAPDQNEISVAVALLKGLPLDGAIITGDAIFTQRETCRHICGAQGQYLFVVNDNQPALKAAIAGARNAALAIIGSRGQNVREARENFREDRTSAIHAVTGTIL